MSVSRRGKSGSITQCLKRFSIIDILVMMSDFGLHRLALLNCFMRVSQSMPMYDINKLKVTIIYSNKLATNRYYSSK